MEAISPPVITAENAPALSPANFSSENIFWRKEILAGKLISPDGLVIDQATGDLYISEEDAATVVRISINKVKTRIIDSGTPVYGRTNGTRSLVEGLRSPEGLALDKKGDLYVVEDIPGGRLISFNLAEHKNGALLIGTVIPIPLPDHSYAWESIDISPNGELILAGSGMESFTQEYGGNNMLYGVIIYRDTSGTWWMPFHHFMSSYSSACFSANGMYAYFADELLGTVGCLSLTSRVIQTYYLDETFKSPECITPLPDGSALLAEESGKIYRVDPTAETNQLIYDLASGIESIYWNSKGKQLLVTADQSGDLVSLNADVTFHSPLEIIPQIPFDPTSQYFPAIPEKCPGYLAGVLKRAGFDPSRNNRNVSFKELVRRLSVFAIDSDAVLSPLDDQALDPVNHVQFAVFSPYLFGVDMGVFTGPISGFAAAHKSGNISQTKMYSRQMLHVDLENGMMNPFGSQRIALPYPLGAHLSADGIASIHFMGVGETSDYHIVLNTKSPEQSYMYIVNLDGSSQQYQLRLPRGKNLDHWVIGLKVEEPETWVILSGVRVNH